MLEEELNAVRAEQGPSFAGSQEQAGASPSTPSKLKAGVRLFAPPPLSSQACPSFSPLMRPTQQQDGMAEKNKLLVKQLKQERATIRTLQAQLDEAERTLDAALAEQNRQLHAS